VRPLDRESFGDPSRVLLREEPSGASLAGRFGWATIRHVRPWLVGMATVGSLVLLSFLGVDCSHGAERVDAGEASSEASSEPSGSYQNECAQRWWECRPKDPVAVPSEETTCAQLGIEKGKRCQLGEPSCLDGPMLVERDAATSPCRQAAEHLLCLPGFEDKGCPSSTAKVKKHIEYLTPAEVSEAAREIRDLPLVRYRYKSQGDGVTPTVGIIIEDVPGASFVDHENQRVNLYSFVSATAAAYQAQAKELEALKARLAAVEATCGQGGPSPATSAARAIPMHPLRRLVTPP
jgi:hypothetical protein